MSQHYSSGVMLAFICTPGGENENDIYRNTKFMQPMFMCLQVLSFTIR